MGECDRSGSEPHTESGVISPKSRREDDGDSDEDGEDVLLTARRRYNTKKAAPKVKEVPPAAAQEVKKPTDEDRSRAASLATHEYVKDLFFSYARPKVPWPSDDYIGDQLKDYVRAETTKRPRLEGTMATIPEAADAQPSSSA